MAAGVLSRYGVEGAGVEPLAGAQRNRLFAVTTAGGERLVLRAHRRNGSRPDRIRWSAGLRRLFAGADVAHLHWREVVQPLAARLPW